MTKADVVLLNEYSRWANHRILRAAAVPAEQFTRDLGGGLRSLRDALVHIVAGEWGWLQYWREAPRSAAALADLWTRCDTMFHPEKFADIDAVRARWAEVEQELAEFVNRLTEESLAETFPVHAIEISLAHLMQHLANHSTYHRGQAAMMLRQLGVKPPATDFHRFLAEVFPAFASETAAP